MEFPRLNVFNIDLKDLIVAQINQTAMRNPKSMTYNEEAEACATQHNNMEEALKLNHMAVRTPEKSANVHKFPATNLS